MTEQLREGIVFYKDTFLQSRAIPAIVLFNILVYAFITIFPNLAEVLLLSPSEVYDRPWTLITVFFSHNIHVHLLVNLLVILVFGLRLETETGPIHVLTIYSLAGLAGSLAILVVADLGAYSGPIPGASAAALGLLTAFGVMSPNTVVGGSGGEIKTWVMIALGINLLGIISEVIGAADFGIVGGTAHLAGMLAGLIFGSYLTRD